MGVRNLRIVVEYDGTDFAGFQVQPSARTVQGALEEAVATVTRDAVRLAGAGRTDAGVHARGQVASFYTECPMSTRRLLAALNGTTPDDITVRAVEEVDWDFHARHSAIGKVYSYTLAHGLRPALDRHRVGFTHKTLDLDAMRDAAARLIGRHDFAAFQGAASPRSTTVRTLRRLALTPTGPGELVVRLEADGFLYKMCRAIVGTLVEVGSGRREASSVAALLRPEATPSPGATAEARGLCLEEVLYP